VAGTPRRFGVFTVVVVAVVIAVSGIVAALDPQFNTNNNSWGNNVGAAVVLVAFALVILTGLYTLVQRAGRRGTRRTAAKVDRQFRDEGIQADTVGEAVSQYHQAVGSTQPARRASDALVEQRARRLLVESSVAEASLEMVPFLPRLPRSVKRVANRMYLIVSIAVTRDMFGGDPPLEAHHLGKWVVLLDHWPDLAQAVIRDPSLAGRLEKSDSPSLDGLLPPGIQSSEELVAFWHEQTRIGDVAERLVSAMPSRRLRAREKTPVIALT